ncbi:hypothetical protein C1752_02688 [Acaryochloris thomasi RCC1774]|uniref:Uncharacterized protein n=1 Tax=Acaryochloris thomasi RCC1774 TaxID=1764569 RepID=A0A2W1JWP5_9CYAN|nr:hypothetical protein [Acaryochloris thomasi]PZD73131.1 hypothetical protein C1752_02688 [Acaryochloris thomasi RCC1774]
MVIKGSSALAIDGLRDKGSINIFVLASHLYMEVSLLVVRGVGRLKKSCGEMPQLKGVFGV